MALSPCPECSKIISDQAFFCPNCGYPLHPQVKNVLVKTVRGITDIAKNIFSFFISAIFLLLSVGVLMYVSIRAFDFLSRNYLK
jgi:RNA polymerase subunit RPABC4/transcription elongation factor Spt4